MSKANQILMLETDLVLSTRRERKHAFFTKSSEAISAFKKRVKEAEAEIETMGVTITNITNADPADLTPYAGKFVKDIHSGTVSIYVLGEYNNKHIDITLYSYC